MVQWATFTTNGGFSNWTFPKAFATGVYQVTGIIQLSSTGIAMLKWNPAASSTTVASIAATDLNNQFISLTFSVFAVGK